MIKIVVRNKIARLENPLSRIVSENTNYAIHFDLDDEWTGYETKTARFQYQDGTYSEVIFDGDTVQMPLIENTEWVKVGLYAGDLHTSTPATIGVRKSILSEGGVPADPPPDVYAQLMERLNELEAPAAVLYDIEQNLADEEKERARENIHAESAGTVPTIVNAQYTTSSGTICAQKLRFFVMNGWIKVPDEPIGIGNCMYLTYLSTPSAHPAREDEVQRVVMVYVLSFARLRDAGYVSDTLQTADSAKAPRNWWSFEYTEGSTQINFEYRSEQGEYGYGTYDTATGELVGEYKYSEIIRDYSGAVKQFKMSGAPTEDLQVATKQYVDKSIEAIDIPSMPSIYNYVLENLPDSSEEIGTLSDLTTTEKSNLVSAINEVNRKADDKWELIFEDTTTEDLVRYEKSTDSAGKTFALRKAWCVIFTPRSEEADISALGRAVSCAKGASWGRGGCHISSLLPSTDTTGVGMYDQVVCEIVGGREIFINKVASQNVTNVLGTPKQDTGPGWGGFSFSSSADQIMTIISQEVEALTTFALFGYTAHAIPKGTRVALYGVRK